MGAFSEARCEVNCERGRILSMARDSVLLRDPAVRAMVAMEYVRLRYGGGPVPGEPKNRHEPWCNVWTHETLPCNCGAG